MKLNTKIIDLKKKGYCILKKQISKKKCNIVIDKLEKILNQRIKQRKYIGNMYTRMLISYFRENLSLLEMINLKNVNLILSKVIDKDYVLINSNAMDASINKTFYKKGDFAAGESWHTDSRFVGGKRLDKGFNFLVILALDQFTKKNGSTCFLPNSHLIRTKIKNFDKYKILKMEKGDVCILDASIWHKRGKQTNLRRWSIFSMYGPWFMKPYYNYEKLLGKSFKKIKKNYKKLLHFNSTPPQSHDERIATLNYNK